MQYVSNFFQLECLQAHNRFRALHGCPPLKLNKHLTEFATNWAQKLGELNIMAHSNIQAYGENVFIAEGMEINGESAPKFWYKERTKYNSQHPKYSEDSSNFTQLVWKESSHLGVGGCMLGDVAIVVTHYHPPGNIEGQFEKNVPPLILEETPQQRCARLLEQIRIQQQKQLIYCQKLREHQKLRRVLEQQSVRFNKGKPQEQQKDINKLHEQKLQSSSADVLAKTSGLNAQVAFFGLAALIVVTVTAYGAYSYMR